MIIITLHHLFWIGWWLLWTSVQNNHLQFHTMTSKSWYKGEVFSRAVVIGYTGKFCHRGKRHSGNCHSWKRWMSRPFVHSGSWNVKHTLSNVLVFHNSWKCIICHFITWRRYMLLTEPFAMLSMPSFDSHLPPCTKGLLIHLSPVWQLPLWQLPLFSSVA